MQHGRFPCSRPFKFILVGDCESGKSSLIQKFLSECRKGELKNENRSDTLPASTLNCERHVVGLQAKVEYVCPGWSSSTSLSSDDIASRLWQKKYPNSFSNPNLSIPPDDIPLSTISVRFIGKREWKHKETAKTSNVATNNPISKHPQKDGSGKDKNILKKSPNHRDYASLETTTNATDVQLEIWDTAGDKNFSWHKWYACTDADAVLLCVPLSVILNVNDFHTEDSACLKNHSGCVERIHKFKSNKLLMSTKTGNYHIPPVLLIGTKSDQRENTVPYAKHVSESMNKLEDSLALELADEIGCCDFLRCSSLTGAGVMAVFETAVAISLTNHRMLSEKNEIDTGVSDAESSLANEVKDPTYFKIYRSQDKNSTNKKCHVTTAPGSIKHERLPCIYFPPPPLTSPPSTGPPSTTSSKTISSSSLESINDFINDQLVGSTERKSEYTILNDTCFEDKVVNPEPAPRLHKEKLSEKETTTDKIPIPTSPKPKMRMTSPSSVMRRSSSRQKRREGIFIKFLHTN